MAKSGVIRWCGRSAEAADWERIKDEDSLAGRIARNQLAAACWLLFGSEEDEAFQVRVERVQRARYAC